MTRLLRTLPDDAVLHIVLALCPLMIATVGFARWVELGGLIG